MKLTRTLAAGLLALGSALSAQAHNAWLMPSTTVLSKGEWITVDAAVSNDLFFFNHQPLNIEKLLVTAPDGSTLKPENAHRGKLRNVFDLNLTQPGTYHLAVVNAGLIASYKDAAGQNKRWRGAPENLVKDIPAGAQNLRVTQNVGRVETFVTVGKPSAIKASGVGLELVPVTHPNDLVKGEKATLAFHADGQPAVGLEVTLVTGGTRYRDQLGEIRATTDAQGQISVTWPTAGVYWVDADLKDNKTTIPQATERRLSYVGTLEVLP